MNVRTDNVSEVKQKIHFQRIVIFILSIIVLFIGALYFI